VHFTRRGWYTESLDRETWLRLLLVDDLQDFGVKAWHPVPKNSGSLVLWPSKMNPCGRSRTSDLHIRHDLIQVRHRYQCRKDSTWEGQRAREPEKMTRTLGRLPHRRLFRRNEEWRTDDLVSKWAIRGGTNVIEMRPLSGMIARLHRSRLGQLCRFKDLELRCIDSGCWPADSAREFVMISHQKQNGVETVVGCGW
jgi:hypothetical protein